MPGRPAAIPEIRFTTLSKSGHSRVVNINRMLLAGLGWPDGCALEQWIEGGCLIVARARSNRDAGDALPAGERDATSGSERRRR